jgi:hypothetical protein
MLTPSQVADLRAKAALLVEPVNIWLIEDFCRRVSAACEITKMAEYSLWRAHELGMPRFSVELEVSRQLSMSFNAARKLVVKAADMSYKQDYARLQGRGSIPPRRVRDLIKDVEDVTDGAMRNISGTLGMIAPSGKPLPLRDAYVDACDWAHNAVRTMAMTHTQAVRHAARYCVQRGLQFIDYESGRSDSADVAIRRATITALGRTQAAVEERVHDELGCDGWEISAHACSAPDHEPIQGLQYTDEEYQRLNSSLVRPIGTLNCQHVSVPIILGVSSPLWTKNQLEDLRKDNQKGIIYQGKHYTGYEATQRQRELERRIRDLKRHIAADKGAGDTDALKKHQTKLRVTREAYRDFSKAAGLVEQPERTWIPEA